VHGHVAPRVAMRAGSAPVHRMAREQTLELTGTVGAYLIGFAGDDLDGFRCTADGIFGKQTELQLSAFQRAVGVNASGVGDASTLKLLARGLPGVRDLKSCHTGEDVRAFQRILGLHQIACAVDGAFGGLTQASVQSFQRKYGLSASGVVDEDTRMASWIK
jgi:hypothetical protein